MGDVFAHGLLPHIHRDVHRLQPRWWLHMSETTGCRHPLFDLGDPDPKCQKVPRLRLKERMQRTIRPHAVGRTAGRVGEWAVVKAATVANRPASLTPVRKLSHKGRNKKSDWRVLVIYDEITQNVEPSGWQTDIVLWGFEASIAVWGLNARLITVLDFDDCFRPLPLPTGWSTRCRIVVSW
jgi:hypothetical protein